MDQTPKDARFQMRHVLANLDRDNCPGVSSSCFARSRIPAMAARSADPGPSHPESGGGSAPAQSTRQLPVLLHRTREALGVYFRPVLAAHDLTDPQWRVLRILDVSDECDVSSLARRSFLMQPSLSRILRDLTARGLIARRTSSKDGRRYFQRLTPKGRRLIKDVAPDFDPAFNKIEKCFGVKRIQRLNEELQQLLEALQRNGTETQSSAGGDDGEAD